MDEIIKILIGGLILVAGYFIGDWIANLATEEVQKGKNWFFILVILGLSGGIYGFITKDDFILFTFFFIAIVSSRSLRKSLEMKGEKGGNKKNPDKKDSGKKKPQKQAKKKKNQ